jgi:hypothetical protein
MCCYLPHVVSLHLRNSMCQSPSCVADFSSASQEILRVLWNLKFHHRIFNSLPLVCILNQTNPAQASTHQSVF